MKQYTLNELAELIAGLTEALNANTEALLKAPEAPQKAVEAPEAPQKAVEAPEGGYTAEEIEALVIAVKNKHGAAKARAILNKVCGTTSVRKIQPEDFVELAANLEASLAESAKDGMEETPDTQTKQENEEALRAKLDAAITAYIKDENGDTIKDHFDTVKSAIQDVGGVAKKADIPADKLQTVIDAVNAAAAYSKDSDDL